LSPTTLPAVQLPEPPTRVPPRLIHNASASVLPVPKLQVEALSVNVEVSAAAEPSPT